MTHDDGINTALPLTHIHPQFVCKNFNVVLERTVRELNGEPYLASTDSCFGQY